MNNNDILRILRYAVDCGDNAMLEMLRLGGRVSSKRELNSFFSKMDEEGYVECNDLAMAALLDGMIILFRGRKEGSPDSPPRVAAAVGCEILDNTKILKKIRIALSLQEADLLTIMELGGMALSRGDLSALFRRKGQKNYKECPDHVMQCFLSGLAKYKRNPAV
jgi:uncharacterized protein YehS (DUF1456 family)